MSTETNRTSGPTATTAVRAVSDGAKKAATAGASAAQSAGAGISRGATASWQAVGNGSRWVFDSTSTATAHVFASAQALVASDLSSVFNQVVAAAVKGAPTIYDKAMDAVYIDTHIGGSLHRLFDGGHTISGAFSAAHNAATDDTLMQETLGALQGLLRDVSTPRGLPLANWSKSTFDAVAESLSSNFGIPKSWLYDLNTYDVGDLLGGTIGAVSVIFGWNKADTESFSQIASSMAFSAALSTNPLLMPISVVALARAFHKARADDDSGYSDLADGAFKGALVSGSSLGAIALVGVAGGPAGLAMVAGMAAAIAGQAAAKKLEPSAAYQFVKENVDFDEVSQFVKDEARTVMDQIAAQASTVGDSTVSFAVKAGIAVSRGASTTADVVGRQSSRAARVVAAGTVAAASSSAYTATAAGRATVGAAQAASRAGATAATATQAAIGSAARRTRARFGRTKPESQELNQ